MNRKILDLAVPNILSNLSVPLLGIVDTALVGHMQGLHHLGAVAIGGTIFNFLYWSLGSLRMGTTGLTAQAFGEKNTAEIALSLARSMLLAVSIAAILLILRTPIGDLSFYLFEASQEVEKHGLVYFDIRLLAAPAALALYALNGWFLGVQNARIPLLITISGNLLNIAVSLYLVKAVGMQSEGVAWGTVIAQYVSLLIAIAALVIKYRHYFAALPIKLMWAAEVLKRFFDVNRDIFIRTLCLVFAFTYFTAQSATLGDAILGANTLLMQFWTILSYGVDGFAFAAESLVGKYIGERNRNGLKLVIRYIFIWAVSIALILTAIYWLAAPLLLRVFTDQPQLIALALTFVGWTIAAPLINTFCYIWDGIFIGATDGRALRNSMVLCTFLVFLPLIWLLKEALGNHGLWMAMTVFMATRGLSLFWVARTRIPAWISS